MHLTLDDYLLVLRGEVPVSVLVRLAHAHLLETCSVCAVNWEAGSAADALPAPLPRIEESATPTRSGDVPAAWLIHQEKVDRQRTRVSRHRLAASQAREDLQRLLRLPVGEWSDRVARARTRFRSRAFAQHLLAESRRRVRSEPRQAAALVALVPQVLAWTKTQPELTWAPRLLARAAAHHANALRVAGDLQAAAQAFRDLRAELGRQPADAALDAEVDSLEASLAIGQRDFETAENLLARSTAAYRRAGSREGEIRTCIQLANLMQTLGHSGKAVTHHARAAELIDVESDPALFVCTVTGRVNALCDLDRAVEAGELLDAHEALYRREEDAYTDSFHRLLRGRVALGLGRFEEATDLLRQARDAHLELDRDYDAIVTSLYLADALLAAGRLAELRDLTAELVPLFRARGVARETLAALRLLAQAAAAETLTAAVLQDVRRRLEGAPAVKGE